MTITPDITPKLAGPIEFTLQDRPLGWATHSVTPSEMVEIRNALLVSPNEPAQVVEVLVQLQGLILDHIPGLPPPEQLPNLLVLIRNDLSGLAYINGLSAAIKVRPTVDVVAGESADPAKNVASVVDFKFNVDVPDDVAVIVVQSHGWRRAVYFDLGPIAVEPRPRIGPLSKLMALQTAELWGVERRPEIPARTRVDGMADGYQTLRRLLDERCDKEVEYQELLEDHPWMLGLGTYSRFQRHGRLDGEHIPDFTGRRASDGTDDIIELKQPFLKLFNEDGGFSVNFHNAWHQAESYLALARDERDYLRRQKGMRFETPRCLLLVATAWCESEARLIRIKDQSNPLIRIMTYEELLAQANNVLSVMRTALLDE